LPVSTFRARTRKFARLCGAEIPTGWNRLFDGLDDHPAARQLVAATVAAEMCRRPLCGPAVRGFHFYTLNRAELSFANPAICGHPDKAGRSAGKQAAETKPVICRDLFPASTVPRNLRAGGKAAQLDPRNKSGVTKKEYECTEKAAGRSRQAVSCHGRCVRHRDPRTEAGEADYAGNLALARDQKAK